MRETDLKYLLRLGARLGQCFPASGQQVKTRVRGNGTFGASGQALWRVDSVATRVGCEMWVLCSSSHVRKAQLACDFLHCLITCGMVGIVVPEPKPSWTATLGHRTLWLSPQIPPRMTPMLTDLVYSAVLTSPARAPLFPLVRRCCCY